MEENNLNSPQPTPAAITKFSPTTIKTKKLTTTTTTTTATPSKLATPPKPATLAKPSTPGKPGNKATNLHRGSPQAKRAFLESWKLQRRREDAARKEEIKRKAEGRG